MNIRRLLTSLVFGLGVTLAFLWLLITGSKALVYADTYTVINTNASGSGSLRQAIIETNNTAGHDTIAFTSDVTGTIVLTDALPAIYDDLTIIGPGAGQLVISGNNAYRVFFVTTDTAVTITGVTIQDGYADNGGGIWNAGNLHLDDAHILDNSASSSGGGMFIEGGSVVLTGTQVISNLASSRGGGVYVYQSGATLNVSGGEIDSNSAGYSGGGVCVEQGSATLTGTRVTNNSAQAAGGGVFIPSGNVTLIETHVAGNSAQAGGGVFVEGSNAVAVLIETQVIGNLATAHTSWGGGGLYVERGSATLVGTQVVNNSATTNGGGVYVKHGNAALTGTQVINNSAINGGGIFLGGGFGTGSDVTLDNTVIANNQVADEGSGVYVENNNTARLRHNTIAGNIGGSGIHVALNSTVALTNTILVSHTVGITVTAGSTATLENTLWGSEEWANNFDWGGVGTVITGTINLWGNPAFVAPETGDYHIAQNSAAIDKAVETDVDIDIDGDPRPIGPAPEIGADETKIWIYLPVTINSG